MTEAPGPGPGGGEPLPCARDNVKIDPARPRCPHPSSACPFREACPVIDAARARKKGRPAPPPPAP